MALKESRSSAKRFRAAAIAAAAFAVAGSAASCRPSAHPMDFDGNHFSGRGDARYLELLDFSRRLFQPDPEYPNLSMLYQPEWNGLVEGPTWNAWWIQNSYGTAYAAMPFLPEPFLTFLANAQALWFDAMGDGRRRGRPNDEVAPDGSLCDCAGPGWAIYKQGDGRTKIHDWGFEFAAAGIVMQAELLLETRDVAAIAGDLPRLERVADFIDSRRDPGNNLFLVGAAANLLAPSYAGRLRPDGTYDKAYLAGLSITTIAALDRLAELETLAGRPEKAAELSRRRDLVRSGLPLLRTPRGCFVKSVDPDGTKHGVYGAPRFGYFETSPNHDAIALRVVSDGDAEAIMRAIEAIPQLRPYDLILPNYPGLDDMYEKPEGLWAFGHWVNGGHWSTCEARMVLAYARLGRFEDARRSVLRMKDFARRFRMDNPLTKFGSEVYQPKEPVNITIDAFGPMAALVRGLFEYVYTADALTLYPHVPPGVTELHQKDPVRFGAKRLFLSTYGSGPVAAFRVNGGAATMSSAGAITLRFDALPETSSVEVYLGGAKPSGDPFPIAPGRPVSSSGSGSAAKLIAAGEIASWSARCGDFLAGLKAAGFERTYEAAHARLVLDAIQAAASRRDLIARGAIAPLPAESAAAADQAYADAALKLARGLDAVLKGYRDSADPRKAAISKIYLGDKP